MSGTPNPAAVSPPPAAALESNRGHPTQEKKLSVEVMLETPSRSLPHWVHAIESGGKGFVTTIHRAQADLSSGDVHWIFGRGDFPHPPAPSIPRSRAPPQAGLFFLAIFSAAMSISSSVVRQEDVDH